jgi:FkbH-like protein
MVEPVVPYLKYLAIKAKLKCDVHLGEYNQALEESFSISGNSEKQEDCIILFQHLDTLSEQITKSYNSLSANERKKEFDRIFTYISSIVKNICEKTNTPLLFFGFILPMYPALGIADAMSGESQRDFVRRLNSEIKNLFTQHQNAYFIPMDIILERLGEERFYDYRYWHIGKAPYSREALNEIACEAFKHIRALKGLNKKCLVLDCDNTLWGGIIGEDSIENIKIGKSYPGSMYYEFQQAILDLHNRGVILCLCSKNNENDVWEVFEKHPDMILKKEHISASRINWNDKATNIRELAEELNIGLESMIFVDDSEFETNWVNENINEVEVICLNKNDAPYYARKINALGAFDTLSITAEDRKRGKMYKAEVQRKNLSESSTTLEDYYCSLNMEITIGKGDSFSIPRISQLTQKTNQFNLTTKRYSEAEIKSFCDSENYDVFHLKLVDKFGDSGIVGVAIIKYNNNEAEFDSFILSCRVLGRGVETAFINFCCEKTFERKILKINGIYIPTKKNGQTANFYEKSGFKHENTIDKRSIFSIENLKGLEKTPEWFKITYKDLRNNE